VHEQLGDAQRQARERRGELVALGHPARRAAHQAAHDARPYALRVRFAQIADGGLADGAGQRDPRLRARRAGGQPRPRPGPQRELAARGVAGGDHPSEVQARRGGRNVRERIDPRSDVLERRGPPAARPPADAQAAVLEVPHCPAAAEQIEGKRVHQRAVEARPPEAAV